jgi:undecaprenyl-phosphate galactose phosphotransferase
LALLAADLLAAGAAMAPGAGTTMAPGAGTTMALCAGPTPQAFDLAIAFAALLAYLALGGRYSERIPFWNEAKRVAGASLCAACGLALLGLRLDDLPARLPTLLALPLFAVLASAANRLAKRALTRAGAWTLPVLVLGDADATAQAAFGADRTLGYRVVGRIDPASVMTEAGMPEAEMPGGEMPGPQTAWCWPLLRRHRARCLLIALDGDADLQRRLTECALRERAPFAVLAQPHGLACFTGRPMRFPGHDAWLLTWHDGLSHRGLQAAKAILDVTVAGLALLLASPLLLLLAVMIRRDGGPALFAHRRIGAGGQPFPCLKFRTMVVDADQVLAEALAHDPEAAAEWAARRKLAQDPRITRLGRFLRRTSLDELPQLINVLRREMSLVGPRPIVESEVPLYGAAIAQYYATRPGLTGLWQVSGRSGTSYARRVQLDVWYVNNWSLWHDLAVLLKTVPAVLGRDGAQ